jgi:hypothetical protein
MKQVGNPDGEDKPNKKYFDPRGMLFPTQKQIVAH